jgi:hypothetical protein
LQCTAGYFTASLLPHKKIGLSTIADNQYLHSIIMTNCGYKVNMTVILTYRVAAFLSQTGNSFPTAEVTIFIVLIKLVLR